MLKGLLLNNQKVTEGICAFLSREFAQRHRTLAVMGFSGGVDSAVAAALCRKAGLSLLAVSMPYGKLSNRGRVKRVARIINLLPNQLTEVDITDSVNRDIELIEKQFSVKLNKIQKGNLMARKRMTILYDRAWSNGLVVGTENLSEYYLGYFTLHGDQACDLNPLGGLFKTQVMELARYLGIPLEIPSAELYPGQTDEKELGFSYEKADPILYLYCIKKTNPEKITKDFGLDADLVNRVVEKVRATKNKREEIPKYEIY